MRMCSSFQQQSLCTPDMLKSQFWKDSSFNHPWIITKLCESSHGATFSHYSARMNHSEADHIDKYLKHQTTRWSELIFYK